MKQNIQRKEVFDEKELQCLHLNWFFIIAADNIKMFRKDVHDVQKKAAKAAAHRYEKRNKFLINIINFFHNVDKMSANTVHKYRLNRKRSWKQRSCCQKEKQPDQIGKNR